MNKLFFTILLATTTAAFSMNPHERFPDVWQQIQMMQSFKKEEYGCQRHKNFLNMARLLVDNHLKNPSNSQDYVLYVLAAAIFFDQAKTSDMYVQKAIELMKTTKETVPFRRPRNTTITLQRAVNIEANRIGLNLNLFELPKVNYENHSRAKLHPEEDQETLFKKLMLTKLIQYVIQRHIDINSSQKVIA